MTTTSRARHMLQFKPEAVRLVVSGQSLATVAHTLGLVNQALFNWVKTRRQGKLIGVDSKLVIAGRMESSRLHTELGQA